MQVLPVFGRRRRPRRRRAKHLVKRTMKELYFATETASLIERVQNGDEEAATAFFKRYLPCVRQVVALRLGKRRRDLEDDLVLDAITHMLDEG